MSLRKLFAALSLAACSATAHAQVSRVFVSVTGNDGNVCSNVATPCRTFAGGITQVDAQGEVIVIDSGSYAGGTITKSVKINVPAGIVAFSGLPIVVNPGGGGIVVVRGLTLKASTPGSGTGIDHQSGTLFVENTVVDGWSNGLVSQSPERRSSSRAACSATSTTASTSSPEAMRESRSTVRSSRTSDSSGSFSMAAGAGSRTRR